MLVVPPWTPHAIPTRRCRAANSSAPPALPPPHGRAARPPSLSRTRCSRRPARRTRSLATRRSGSESPSQFRISTAGDESRERLLGRDGAAGARRLQGQHRSRQHRGRVLHPQRLRDRTSRRLARVSPPRSAPTSTEVAFTRGATEAMQVLIGGYNRLTARRRRALCATSTTRACSTR